MNYLLYIFQLILIQYTTAQVITLGGRNFLNNQNCNLQPNYANAGLLASLGQPSIASQNLGQEYVTSSLISSNNYGNNIGLTNNLGQEYLTPGLTNNLGQEYLIPIGNANYANSNIDLAGGNIGLVSSNIGNEIVAYNAVPKFANVVKPPREYGIEFSSGALSVGGNVEVNGRMPFNANVALQGVVAAQGQGAVDYKCDQLGAEES